MTLGKSSHTGEPSSLAEKWGGLCMGSSIFLMSNSSSKVYIYIIDAMPPQHQEVPMSLNCPDASRRPLQVPIYMPLTITRKSVSWADSRPSEPPVHEDGEKVTLEMSRQCLEVHRHERRIRERTPVPKTRCPLNYIVGHSRTSSARSH